MVEPFWPAIEGYERACESWRKQIRCNSMLLFKLRQSFYQAFSAKSEVGGCWELFLPKAQDAFSHLDLFRLHVGLRKKGLQGSAVLQMLKVRELCR